MGRALDPMLPRDLLNHPSERVSEKECKEGTKKQVSRLKT